MSFMLVGRKKTCRKSVIKLRELDVTQVLKEKKLGLSSLTGRVKFRKQQQYVNSLQNTHSLPLIRHILSTSFQL